MRPFLATDRRVRLLQVLVQAGEGMSLLEVSSAIGAHGRRNSKANVVMLKELRKGGLVGFGLGDAAEPHDGVRPGPVSGLYSITPKGLTWLQDRGFLPEGEGELEVVITTGAMRGEVGHVLRTTACDGQVPRDQVLASVFDLARPRHAP